jgi:CheY-like chemotaxis protein/anti-sigma regulatory factor (Ser/Thr protein kinase)
MALGEAERLRIQAEAANTAKSVFLANMSHEIRTPLNAILGYAQLLIKQPGLSDELYRGLVTINRSGEHLLAIINDLLDMAKIEAGRMTLSESDFDLRQLVDDLLTMFEQRADQAGLTLTGTGLDVLPRWVRGDVNKVRQVLMNLLSNAIKFTAAGVVEVRAQVLADAMIEITVRDEGRGIPQDDIERIFDRFEQVSASRVEIVQNEGTGLGLPISLRIARLMGGNLSAESEAGVGSTFCFTFPVKEAVEGVHAASGDTNRSMRLVDVNHVPLALVVDDQDSNRDVLCQMLAGIGVRTVTAVNGRAAVDAFVEHKPSLVFMDLRMPVMGGVDSMGAIRRVPGGDAAKIIIVSASVFDLTDAHIEEYKANGAMSKPFRESELNRVLMDVAGIKLTAVEQALQETETMSPSGRRSSRCRLSAQLYDRLGDSLRTCDPQQVGEVIDVIAGVDSVAADEARQALAEFDFTRVGSLFVCSEAERA